MSELDSLLTRKTGTIGWVIFNNPARHNAVSIEMARTVPDAVRKFEEDSAIRVVVVSGAGQKAFIAGSDIQTFGKVRHDPETNQRYNEINERSYNAVYQCSKPTIAMIRGYCIGGGLDFATSCDVRICSSDATFAVPAGRLGLGYGHEGLVRLGRVIGLSGARDLLLSARRLDADEALRIGLVNSVVPVDTLEAQVTEYARSIAANAPLTLAALKRSFLELEKPHKERDMTACQAMINACFTSTDYLEGRVAFKEKRRPVFRGQ